MASIRKRRGKWQVQIRRKGSGAVSRTFHVLKDAQAWARHMEARADRGDLPAHPEALRGTTLGRLVERYRDTVSPRKRTHAAERAVLNIFLRHPICRRAVSDVTTVHFAAYRDERLKDLKPVSVKRQYRLAIFRQSLQNLGWTSGRDLQIDDRWARGDTERARTLATELVELQPDVILGEGTSAVVALKQATRTIPIVFTNVSDPVGSGFVASMERPGGNITGFTNFESPIGGKWLQVLKEVFADSTEWPTQAGVTSFLSPV